MNGSRSIVRTIIYSLCRTLNFEIAILKIACSGYCRFWANIVNNWEPEEERTPAELLAHTQRQWELLTNREPFVRDIVSSIPNRFMNVIEKEGGWTRY